MPPLDESSLFARLSFEAQALVTAHPPRLTHPNKRLVHALACPPGAQHGGTITLSRWRAMPLPAIVPPPGRPEHRMREDIFGYEPAPEGSGPEAIEWYVNFADRSLFVAYGGPLLAQDEMQALEHPALGSIREALKAAANPLFPALTRDGDLPAPVLVMGVERRCALDTGHDAAMPYGLYGNRFARASPEVLRKATKVLTPPTISNLIAMEAPPGGSGAYLRSEIEDVISTAFTAFTAAGIESRRATGGKEPKVIVHTGHWGTGAYGGNKVLMAALQMLAARLAGVDQLVFHTVSHEGSTAYREAHDLVERVPAFAPPRTSEHLDALEARRFAWGVSDGN